MVRPNSEHTDENWFNSVCRFWVEWATSAASSAKSRSRTVIFFTFDFVFRRAGLNRSPSDLVCSLTPIVDEQKERFSSIEKKALKRVGGRSRTLPYFWSQTNQKCYHHIVQFTFLLMWKDFRVKEDWRAADLRQYRKESFPTYYIESFSVVN